MGKRGRPSKTKETKNKNVGICFTPEDLDLLTNLSEELGMDKSKIIRYLLRCASFPANQTLRNLIVNLAVMETVQKKSKSLVNYNPDYHVDIRFMTTYGDVKTASKETQDTVDQQANFKREMENLKYQYQLEADNDIRLGLEPLSWDEWLKLRQQKENQGENTKIELPIKTVNNEIRSNSNIRPNVQRI